MDSRYDDDLPLPRPLPPPIPPPSQQQQIVVGRFSAIELVLVMSAFITILLGFVSLGFQPYTRDPDTYKNNDYAVISLIFNIIATSVMIVGFIIALIGMRRHLRARCILILLVLTVTVACLSSAVSIICFYNVEAFEGGALICASLLATIFVIISLVALIIRNNDRVWITNHLK